MSRYPTDWSDEQKTPAFVVDAAKSQVIAANAAACALFGIASRANLPLSLDSSMPAITRLRLLAKTPQAPQEATQAALRLMFWIDGGLKPFYCDVRNVKNGSQDSSLFAVTVKNDFDNQRAEKRAPADPALIQITEPSVPIERAREPTSLAPAPRDDRETLKEIARQIRDTEASWGFSAGGVPSRDHSGQSAAAISATAIATDYGAKSNLTEPTLVNAATPQDAVSKVPPNKTTRAQNEFDLAKLAHELKTPLSAIAAASEVMRDERFGPIGSSRYRDYAGDIHNSAAHAIDVINAMLGGNGAANVPPDVRNVDLNAVIAETVSSLQPLALEKELDLGFDPEASEPILITDKTALRQILINLLTNALKYTPEGGVVRAATGYLDDGSVFAVVRDTGLGFPRSSGADDETPPPLTHETYGRLQGSHGIGLPLVRQLAAQIGADVEIDSMPGKGTVVLITFPIFASL